MAVQQTAKNETESLQAMSMADQLQLLRDAYQQQRYPSAKQRIDRLQRLWSGLDVYADRLCEALNEDFGYRSAHQSYFADIATTGKSIRLAQKGVKRWMKAQRRKIDAPFSLLGGRGQVLYQPLGVVGILSPWNVPVNLTLTPLAGVLAAGNRAFIKPSEHTPATAEIMQEMLGAWFEPDEIQLVTGDAEVGQAFSRLPLDHLVFTGSTEVGRHIMRSAAENLTPLTLELGGKSPVIIGRGADLQLAAKRIVFGKFFNAGQVCLAPDYVLVPRDQRGALVQAIKQEIRCGLPQGVDSPDYVSVINQRQADRLQSYIDQAQGLGAEVLATGLANGRKMPITLVIDPPSHLAVCQEEIFGPILVVHSYDSMDEALEFVNVRPRPLALYYFGKDAKEQERVVQGTLSGGVTINDVIMHYTFDSLPFGGVGPSGMGAYHGLEGFRQFSHARAIYQQTWMDIGGIIRPPYGPIFEKFTRFLMRYG
ncbi:MAG: coniferyl aldehyde dehydrogenase [Oceanococcus sp.]